MNNQDPERAIRKLKRIKRKMKAEEAPYGAVKKVRRAIKKLEGGKDGQK
jgi:hypothetical protein